MPPKGPSEVMVSVEHIDLAPPGGTIPVLEPRANIRPTVVIPDFDVAEAGALLAGDLGQQHNVFKLYWPTSSAERFSASAPAPAAVQG